MKAQVLTVLLGCLLAGCASAPEPVEINTIVSSDKADFAARVVGREGLVFWTPSRSDVAKALPGIMVFLRGEAPSLAGQFGQYRRQFMGIIVDGRKRIYCSFLRLDGREADGRALPAGSKGDGPAAFRLEYDIESGECGELQVSGE